MRKLSDAECAPAWVPDEDESFALDAEGRSRCSINQREGSGGAHVEFDE